MIPAIASQSAQERELPGSTENPRSEAYIYKLCGAEQSHYADEHAAVTRLTNNFSKKVENLMHAVSLHFMYYNFVRIHQTLRVAPAMEAGIADHVWSVEEIAGLLD